MEHVTANNGYILKLYNTRMIQTSPRIKRNVLHIAVIEKCSNISDILSIPYDIIFIGKETIALAQYFVTKYPERSAQILGAYCENEEEAIVARLIKPNIHIGFTKDFSDVINFIHSLSPAASIWRIGDPLPRFHVLVQVWKHRDPSRLEELQVALLKNATNPLVYRLHVSLDGDDASDVLSKIPNEYMEKITYVPINTRLTFKTAMEYMSSLPKGDFAAVINTDIYFDHTIKELWNISMKNICLALLRYEATVNYALGNDPSFKPPIYGPRADSQDAWIFAVDDLCEHKVNESWDSFDFCFGMPGCDNTMTGELMRRRWSSVNPALSIHIMHLHQTPLREYSRSNLVTHGLYHLIAPTAII
jgi:hypothetical protein